jgi:hypothetical protein
VVTNQQIKQVNNQKTNENIRSLTNQNKRESRDTLVSTVNFSGRFCTYDISQLQNKLTFCTFGSKIKATMQTVNAKTNDQTKNCQ